MPKISNILDFIDSGHFALPEFQRGYVWNSSQVRGLVGSLYRRHPVGSLLVWTTDTVGAPARGNGPLAPGVVKLILDGQQRITSLYGVSRGKPPPFFDGNAKAFEGLFFNVETEEFSFYMAAMKGNPLWLSVTELFQKEGQAKAFQRLMKEAGAAEKLPIFMERIGKLATVLDVDIHVEDVTVKDMGVVVEIFNKLNSGGTKLSKGDLALARICAGWAPARETMKAAIGRWRKADYDFALDLLLRATNAVVKGEAKFEHLDGVEPVAFRDGLTSTEKAIDSVLEHIQARLGLDHDRVLFGRYALPVLAHYLVRRGGKLKDAKEWDQLLFWYLQSAMWGRYSSSVESVMDRDLEALEQLDGGLDRLVSELRIWRGGSLRVQPPDFRASSMGSRFYPVLYLLSRVWGARDFLSGVELKGNLLGKQSRLEVHHVFPKAQLYKKGYLRGEVNAVANFCFLTADSNKAISDAAPEEYFANAEEKNPGVLASQWIPTDPKLWKLEAYRDFLEARRELLAGATNGFLTSLHPMPETADSAPAATVPEVPGGFEPGEEEEARIREARAWAVEQGLDEGRVLHELNDPISGTPVAILDLAWPDGLQPGLGEPVALLLDEPADVVAAASTAGYRCLGSLAQLKKYVKARMAADAA